MKDNFHSHGSCSDQRSVATRGVRKHEFDSILGIKPKNPCVASLLSQEVGSQDIGINLTQFHSCIDKRVNHCSNRAQRARNFISN